MGNVAEAEHFAAGLDAGIADAVERGKLTGDAQTHAIRRRFKKASRRHCILLLQRIENCHGIEAERGQFGVRNVDKNFLILHANQLDFLDIGHPAQFAGDAIRFLA